MDLYGLVGKHLEHSWSENFFTEKFSIENVDACYRLFPMDKIELLPDLLASHPHLKGLNITIPYKKAIIPYLDGIQKAAKMSGAVNTVVIKKRKNETKLIGYNTDIIGFTQTLEKILHRKIQSALILGAGGASQAVQFVLRSKGIAFTVVSRETKKMDQLSYDTMNPVDMRNNLLIINTTPVGMFPHIEHFPNIPYQYITKDHILIDLIYNPESTEFLRKGKEIGAFTMNGLEMLHAQAEAAWRIWNSR